MFRGTHVLQVSSEKSSCVFIVHDIFCGTWSYWPYNCNVAFQLRCEIHGVKDGETRATSTCHMPTSRRSSWHMTFGPSIGLKVSRRLRPRRSEMKSSEGFARLHHGSASISPCIARESRECHKPRHPGAEHPVFRHSDLIDGRALSSVSWKAECSGYCTCFLYTSAFDQAQKIAPCKGWNIWKESHMSLTYMNFISINSLKLDSKQKLCQYFL